MQKKKKNLPKNTAREMTCSLKKKKSYHYLEKKEKP
jgi:hypothetical protein